MKLQISPDCEARVQFRGSVTQEGIVKLIKLLELQQDNFPSIKDKQRIYEAEEAEVTLEAAVNE